MYGSSSFPASSPIQVRSDVTIAGSKSVTPEPMPVPPKDDVIKDEPISGAQKTADLSPSVSSSSLLEVTDHLEIDRFDTRLGICPLLKDRNAYNPDTVDLTRDADARSYWLQCFEDSLSKFAQRAVDSQKEHSVGKFFRFVTQLATLWGVLSCTLYIAICRIL